MLFRFGYILQFGYELQFTDVWCGVTILFNGNNWEAVIILATPSLEGTYTIYCPFNFLRGVWVSSILSEIVVELLELFYLQAP